MDQMTKNKIELMETIEKYGGMPVTRDRTEFLSACHGAYKAICKLEEIKERYHDNTAAAYHGQDYRESIHDEPSQPRLDRETAMLWTGDMVNADGTKGPHWSLEQAKKVIEQRGIDCDPIQFYAALNAVYSDYCAVARRHGVDKPEYYVDMARAWLDDPDAASDKAARYFTHIVKH